MLVECIPDTEAGGGRRCGSCPEGYEGDGFTCIDTNECNINNGGCDVLVTCTNTPGGRTCGSCPSGYEGSGESACTDVNECTTANGGCDPRTECVNVVGGARTCGPCPDGYVGSGETVCRQASATCAEAPNGGCDPLTTCEDTDSGPVCGTCPIGYEGEGTTGCTDIDGCKSNPCYDGVDCVDVPAPDPGLGFVCGECPAGFYGDGKTCNADVCFDNNGGCSSMVQCKNEPSAAKGRTCGACPSGYETTDGGAICTDVNGCQSDPCYDGVRCKDVKAPGVGFTCDPCPAGFTGDGITCTDIDECAAEANGGCDPRTECTNVPGSRTCGPCPPGFRGSGEAGCTPVTTCAENNGGCDPVATCTDGQDGSVCGPCPSGYAGNGTVGCADIDGCADSPCFAGSVCTDVSAPGEGYSCGPCPEGYAGDADIKAGGSCSICSTSASIAAISVAKGRLLRTQDLRVVTNAGMLAEGCTNTQGFVYRWDAIANDKSTGETREFVLTDDTNFRSTKTLFVPRGTLPPDSKILFTFTASLRGEPTVGASVTSEVLVSRADLVAKIAGGGVLTGEATPIVLDASLSSDPDDASGSLSFAWTCSSLAQGDGLCYDVKRERLVLPKVATLPPLNLLGGPQGSPVSYTFTVTASKGQRSSSAVTTADVEKGNPPLVSIMPLSEVKPNPSQTLKLTGTTESSSVSDRPMTLSWSMFDITLNARVDLTQPNLVSSTDLGTRFLSLKANALTSGSQYAVRFEGVDDTGRGASWLNFTTNDRPAGGKLAYELPSSESSIMMLNTTVKLNCLDFVDDDEPLLYLFAARKPDGTEIMLRDYSPESQASSVIPISGEIVLKCYAKDVYKATSDPASVIATVLPPPADQVDAVADSAAATAEMALANGDADSALTNMEGACALLDSPGASRRSASGNTRSKMATTLLQASKIVIPSTETIARVVSAAASVGGGGGDIDTTSASSLVAVVGGAASTALTWSDENLDISSGTAVENSLSALSSASMTVSLESASAMTDPSFESRRRRLSEASALATSIAGAAGSMSRASIARSLPGEQPSVVESANVGIYATRSTLQSATTQEIAQVAGSRIDAASALPTAADGSNIDTSMSAFRFNPRAVDDRSNASSTNATRRTLLNTTGDVSDENAEVELASSAAQLSFYSSDGKALSLPQGSLKKPFLFQLNLTGDRVAPGKSAACALWKKKLSSYSPEGCVGLPNPHPRGVHFEFTKSFLHNLGGERKAKAGAWDLDVSANASHADLTKDCNSTVDADGNRLYTGKQCLMLSDTATSQCPWNNERQAFVGSGCVYDKALECACLTLSTNDDGGSTSTLEMSAAYSFPKKVVVLTADQLFSVSLEDLANIITLVIVICSMFGCATVLAIISDVFAARERKRLLKSKFDGELATKAGFRVESNGAYTWTLDPDMDEDGNYFEPPTKQWGVALCTRLGISVKRLRFCVPLMGIKETIAAMESDSFLNRLERAKSVEDSKTKIQSERARLRTELRNELKSFTLLPDDIKEMEKDTQDTVRIGIPDKSSNETSSPDDDDENLNFRMMERSKGFKESTILHSSEYEYSAFNFWPGDTVAMVPLTLERALGTCLALASLSHGGLLSPATFQKQAKLASELPWPTLPAGLSFAELLSRFCALCAPSGPFKMRRKWLSLADVFRLSMLQHPDGHFNACDEIAVSLRSLLLEDDDDGADDEHADDDDTVDGKAISTEDRASRWDDLRRKMVYRWGALFGKTEKGHTLDRTLTRSKTQNFSPLSMPLIMWSKDNLEKSCPKSMDVSLWTTMLVAENSKNKPNMILNPHAGIEDAIDVGALADRYLEKHRVDTADRAVARAAISTWEDEYEKLIAATRDHVKDALKRESDKKRAERSERWRTAFVGAAIFAMKALFLATLLFFRGLFFLFLGTHILLKLIFIKPTDSFRRSERLWVVMTCFILMFTCSIWIHYQKSQQCCEQLRAHLGCSLDLTSPCLGALKCSEIKKVPKAVGAPACTAFPQKGNILDTVTAIFIVLCIVLPSRMVLQTVFQLGGQAVSPKYFADAAGPDPTLQVMLMQLWEAMFMMVLNPSGGLSRLLLLARKLLMKFKKFVNRAVTALLMFVIKTCFPKVKKNLSKSMRSLSKATSRIKTMTSKKQKQGGEEEDEDEDEDEDEVDSVELAHRAFAEERRLTMLVEGSRASPATRKISEAPALDRLAKAALWSSRYDTLGVVLLVMCWALTAWVAFAFGVLIYDNVGAGAENDFLNSWWQAMSTDIFGVESLKVMGRRALFVLIFRNVSVLFGPAELTETWHEKVLEQGVSIDTGDGDEEDVNDAALGEVADDDALDEGMDDDMDM